VDLDLGECTVRLFRGAGKEIFLHEPEALEAVGLHEMVYRFEDIGGNRSRAAVHR
jgi:hypothetical protein